MIRVGPTADGKGARDVTVVPVANERGLRHLAWIEGNRRKVDELSGGRVAYVHLPDTADGGYTSFNRYFFAQVGKQAAVLDERFNHGGQLADYIIDYLKRPPMSRVMTREGEDYSEPVEAIYRPEGHDHQPVRRLGRGRDAVVLPQGGHRPARRECARGAASSASAATRC